MSNDTRLQNRRDIIKGIGAAGAIGLAGCSGDGGNGNGNGNGGGNGNGNGGNGNGGNDLPEVNMEIGSPYEEDHINVEAARIFKDKIEEESDERFSVQITPGGAYGGDEEHIELVADGSLQGQAAGPTVFQTYAPEYTFLMTPFTAQDWEHHQRIMDSDVVAEGLEKVKEEANQRLIGGGELLYRGERHFTANKAIREPADVEGLDLRLPQFETWVELWETVGANPVPVSLDELYSSLQSGVADASEGAAEQVYSTSLQEVQSHYSLTAHHIALGSLIVSESFYQGLDETYQDMVTELGTEAIQEASNDAQEREESLIDDLESEGMEIVEDVDREAFTEAVEPTMSDLYDEHWPVTTFEEVQNM